ncbi:hypothetical protein H8F23_07315 [Pseudomonas sp. P155]|uniref:Uncharacterized protein n=1 Tax=Pseudomonas neuropathica TaxID=2730425 RepID=A0ABS0BH12_9PSED|nr:hypothetical protein [Pseudomonas neuropathica]MBF6033054.1 hypothetical protein [Pseudomonas neuropathica]
MDLYVAISIDKSSYASDLTKLNLPALLGKAVTEKLGGAAHVPNATILKVKEVTAIYQNWPTKPAESNPPKQLSDIRPVRS